jgi:phenylalanyl-tRNA synthetase alpha subunit
MFHQVEGLVIDKGSHLGHLKWILQEFCKAFFEVDHVKMRFRPSFFPFTEPSLEVDIQCRRDKGEIRFGEGEDWLEILGCGMVHPNVLRIAGSIPTNTRASPGAWASTASPCSNTACPICALLRSGCSLAVALRLPAARFPDARRRLSA